MKIGMPTSNNDDDLQVLLAVEGGFEGTPNAPRNLPVRLFACPPLPTPPIINIGLPPLYPITPRTPSPWLPHFLSRRNMDPWCTSGLDALLPRYRYHIAITHFFCPIPTPYGVVTTTQSSPPPFSMCGNATVCSFLVWDHTIAIKRAPTPVWPSALSHRHPILSEHPEPVRLDTDGLPAAVGDTRDVRHRRPPPTVPSLWATIFLFLKYFVLDLMYTIRFQ